MQLLREFKTTTHYGTSLDFEYMCLYMLYDMSESHDKQFSSCLNVYPIGRAKSSRKMVVIHLEQQRDSLSRQLHSARGYQQWLNHVLFQDV